MRAFWSQMVEKSAFLKSILDFSKMDIKKMSKIENRGYFYFESCDRNFRHILVIYFVTINGLIFKNILTAVFSVTMTIEI